jgi:hypothetical protein
MNTSFSRIAAIVCARIAVITAQRRAGNTAACVRIACLNTIAGIAVITAQRRAGNTAACGGIACLKAIAGIAVIAALGRVNATIIKARINSTSIAVVAISALSQRAAG